MRSLFQGVNTGIVWLHNLNGRIQHGFPLQELLDDLPHFAKTKFDWPVTLSLKHEIK